MSKEVKRYGMCGFESGIVEMEDGPYVHAADYDALLAERDALRDALQAIDRRNDSPARFDKDLDKIVRAALQGAQP